MIFIKGLKNPESPVLLPNGELLIVEMHENRGWIAKIIKNGKKKEVIAKTGRPNGLAVDKDSIIWVAESVNPPSLIRLNPENKAKEYITNYKGQPFLFPNDLCIGPDGAIYMTDSGISYRDWMKNKSRYKELSINGCIYKIDKITKDIKKIDSGIKFANGIAFGPNNYLYVSETITGNIFRYKLSNGIIGKKEEFGNVLLKSELDVKEFRGPDGMAFDNNGNLFVAVCGLRNITILNKNGLLVKRLKILGKSPTNICFGPFGKRIIYITEQELGQVELYKVNVDGFNLFK